MEYTDCLDLAQAKELLENPGLAARISNLIGTPIEKGLERLPENWHGKVVTISQKALIQAMKSAVYTLNTESSDQASNRLHKIAAATSGGIGGFLGLPALAVELPLSTTIMLRSIADIARSEGEAIGTIESQLACIEVFALGGPNRGDDATESGYFSVRTMLAKSVSEAAEYIARKGAIEEGAPAIVRLVMKIAERFGVQVSGKAAAQAIPTLGAAGGALVNTLFMDHFQNMARGHFVVRRLERKYGNEMVKTIYKNA